MIPYHCFLKTKLNQFGLSVLQSSHSLTQKLAPSTARLGSSDRFSIICGGGEEGGGGAKKSTVNR